MKKPCYDKTNLVCLRELTDKLPSLVPFVSEQEKNTSKYRMLGTDREALARNLYHTKDVAIQHATVPRGIFPSHTHNVTEIIIVLSGKVIYNAEGERKEMNPHDYIAVPPGLLHDFRILEDAEMIGILVPSNGGYPGVDFLQPTDDHPH